MAQQRAAAKQYMATGSSVNRPAAVETAEEETEAWNRCANKNVKVLKVKQLVALGLGLLLLMILFVLLAYALFQRAATSSTSPTTTAPVGSEGSPTSTETGELLPADEAVEEAFLMTLSEEELSLAGALMDSDSDSDSADSDAEG